MTLWFETIRYMLSYIREREASLDSLRWKLGFKHYIKNEMSLIARALPYLFRKCFLTKNLENELQVNLKNVSHLFNSNINNNINNVLLMI